MVEQHDAIVAMTTETVHRVLQQAAVRFGIAACQHALDLLRRRDDQTQRMAVEGLLDAGDVDDPKQGLAQGVEDGRGGTGPVLDVDAVVFAGVDLHRLVRGDGCADGIGADQLFAPAAAGREVDLLAGVARPRFAVEIENGAARIAEHDQRARFAQYFAQRLQHRPGRFVEVS